MATSQTLLRTVSDCFIGASERDWQAWALDMQASYNFIERDLIGILDKRNASDETLLIQFYSREPGVEVAEEGIFPKVTDKWHDFRIDYRDAEVLTSSLQFGASDVI
ncbi:hypothetical protein F5Y10DRAFT_267072 [Nemania abortiva]|nr:hypothetical protein F5Y10DRAFT_267072 [Nemania abortiva]